MNIKNFKQGDIITRNAPAGYGGTDSSYCGERLILKGHDPESKIIFFQHTTGPLKGDLNDLSYARDGWDEGWCAYPETLWQKIKGILKK